MVIIHVLHDKYYIILRNNIIVVNNINDIKRLELVNNVTKFTVWSICVMSNTTKMAICGGRAAGTAANAATTRTVTWKATAAAAATATAPAPVAEAEAEAGTEAGTRTNNNS